ncbi:MAG: efflux transporter outer membrane subunit [Nitrospira sp.]|nr:efflux transporter outer membrane subunit [Nitrospira sp.]
MRHNLLSIIFFSLSALALTGLSSCSPHKSLMREDLVDMPAAYSEASEKTGHYNGRWWEQFNDAELNSLISESLINNPNITQAIERLIQSQSLILSAEAARGVSANIDGSAGRSRQNILSRPITKNTYSLSTAAGYEIDAWGKLKSRSVAAGFDADASREELHSLLISISAQITDLYFLAAEQQAQLALSDQTIASFEDTLQRVERRYRAGLVPALDLYQSRQNLSSAQAQRPLYVQGRQQALNAISVLTGNFPSAGTMELANIPQDAPVIKQGIPSELLVDRPDIKAAFARIQAADKRVASAVADKMPSFKLMGTYGRSGDHAILDSPNIFWNILLQAAMPVIDSGRRSAEVSRTESRLRELLAAYRGKVLTAYQEVEDAGSRITASEDRIIHLKNRVLSAENSHRLALDRYTQGLTDYLPVLTAQLSFFNAKSSLLTESRNLVSGRIQLARALGGRWPEEAAEQITMDRGRTQ